MMSHSTVTNNKSVEVEESLVKENTFLKSRKSLKFNVPHAQMNTQTHTGGAGVSKYPGVPLRATTSYGDQMGLAKELI